MKENESSWMRSWDLSHVKRRHATNHGAALCCVIICIPEMFCSRTSCPENGVSYLFNVQRVSWMDAARLCEEAGGVLAKVQSIIEANCISRHLKQNGGRFFIGGNKSSSGDWTWIDGTPITQPTFWAPSNVYLDHENRK
ncbi:C-type lectin domain family 17, member A-like [Saccostrea cucullata]|uniref:C-type lectin domain family 17, member A-like n=1 Tax=Saccostrea cuccullata TaxID=36930 RepID=UPI002ED42EDE